MTGQYGEEGIFTSLPCVIGAEGVEEVYTLDLSEYELEGFHKSCQHIRDNIAQLDWWDAEPTTQSRPLAAATLRSSAY